MNIVNFRLYYFKGILNKIEKNPQHIAKIYVLPNLQPNSLVYDPNVKNIFEKNPFQVKQLNVWIEGDIENGLTDGVKIHVQGNFDLIKFMYGGKYNEMARMLTRENVECVNSNHIIFFKTPSFFQMINRYYIGCLDGMRNMPLSEIFNGRAFNCFATCKDAKIYAALKLEEMLTNFYRIISNRSKRFLKHRFTENELRAKYAFGYNQFVTFPNVKDNARFIKLLFLGKRIYRETSEKFIKHVRQCIKKNKISDVTQFDDFFDYKKFGEYYKRISQYRSSVTITARDEFFNNLIKYKHGRTSSKTSNSI